MKQVLVGSVLAAVVVFLWGFVYWTVLPFPMRILRSVADEPALAGQLRQALPETGTYLLPNMKPGASKEEQDEFMKRHLAGPLVQITYVSQGTNPMTGSVFLGGFVHMWIGAFLMALVVSQAALPTYQARFKLAALAGFAGALYSNLGKPIWWQHPWDYHVMNFAFDVGSWVLAAIVLAWAIKPKA